MKFCINASKNFCVLSALLLAGCSYATEPNLLVPNSPIISGLKNYDRVDTSFYIVWHTASDRLAQIIPGFSGAFKEGDTFVILLAPPYSSEDEDSAIASVRAFNQSADRNDQSYVVKPGRYTFIQFRKWEYQLGRLNVKHRVFSSGFRANQQIVEIWVPDAATQEAYIRDLSLTAVPADVVRVVVKDRPVF